jgi:predicted HTH transcriptional regulator
VEIVNPGGLPKGLSVRNLGTVSIRRNELISDLFFRLHKVERIGMGIQKMKEAMVTAGLREPTFASDAFFRATFQRSPELALKEGILRAEVSEKKPEGKTTQKTAQKTIQKIMGLIRHKPEITRQELAMELGMTDSGIKYHLKKMQAKGLIRRDGLATQMKEVTDRGKRVIRRDAIAQKYGLTARQALAVGYLLENPVLRIEDYEKLCPGTNKRTLQRDLKTLFQKGLLKAEGSARAIRYRLKIKGL